MPVESIKNYNRQVFPNLCLEQDINGCTGEEGRQEGEEGGRDEEGGRVGALVKSFHF